MIKTKYILFLNKKQQYAHCFCLMLCFGSVSLFSQNADDITVQDNPSKKTFKVYAEIINGDTVPSLTFNDVYIIAEYAYQNKKQYEAWTRTKYHVKKVYPYAILAAAKLKEINLVLEKLPTEKQKKDYLKVAEKQLKAEFEESLKDLSVTQGRILLKLIDRETGNTSYEVVKDFRGGFQAFLWQGVARVFGNNMKSEYDPKGEDAMIERAIKLVEAGQF